MALKRKILVSAAIIAATLFLGVLYIAWPFFTIRKLSGRYEQVQRGMTVEQVQTLMAHSPVHPSTDWFPAWEDERVPPSQAARIVSAFRYSVRTFYMPVSFEFTFDSDRRLVGKHIYD
jgi:hypothetical protein